MTQQPTLSRGKQRLPRGWIYPLSAREVEQALGGVSVPSELTLSFYWRPFGLRASEHLALVRDGSALCVLESSYFDVRSRVPSTALGRAPQAYLRAYWSLYVFAVPSAYRQSCRDALLRTGLPAVGRWLAMERPDTWYDGSRKLRVHFVRDAGSVHISEAA